MNIILYNNDGNLAVRYTQPPTEYAEIDTVRVYIQKSADTSQPIAVPTALRLECSEEPGDDGMPFYLKETISLKQDGNLTLDKYFGFVPSAAAAFPAKPYVCTLIADDVEYEVGTFNFANNSMLDEHNALLVKDKTITVVSKDTMLVAEDHLSQEITFLIKEKYDGVSFLDNTKKVYVDYIPVGYKPAEGQPAFFSDNHITRSVASNISDQENWIYLRWRVPNTATHKAGKLSFALAVLGSDYVWQTQPATLTVYPNIGFRGTDMPFVPTDPEEETLAELEERISLIEDNYVSVAGANNEYGLVSSANDGDDEILLGGGSANG